MIWYVISIISFLAVVLLLVYTRIRDRRYEKLKTSEAMRPELWEEIEIEREEALAKREKFREALKKANG